MYKTRVTMPKQGKNKITNNDKEIISKTHKPKRKKDAKIITCTECDKTCKYYKIVSFEDFEDDDDSDKDKN